MKNWTKITVGLISIIVILALYGLYTRISILNSGIETDAFAIRKIRELNVQLDWTNTWEVVYLVDNKIYYTRARDGEPIHNGDVYKIKYDINSPERRVGLNWEKNPSRPNMLIFFRNEMDTIQHISITKIGEKKKIVDLQLDGGPFGFYLPKGIHYEIELTNVNKDKHLSSLDLSLTTTINVIEFQKRFMK
jgi:hypothetical protein